MCSQMSRKMRGFAIHHLCLLHHWNSPGLVVGGWMVHLSFAYKSQTNTCYNSYRQHTYRKWRLCITTFVSFSLKILWHHLATCAAECKYEYFKGMSICIHATALTSRVGLTLNITEIIKDKRTMCSDQTNIRTDRRFSSILLWTNWVTWN